MSKSIKFKNNNYLDTSSITHEQTPLNDILNNKVLYESGSNENGEYIKYADGTMICRKSIKVPTTSISTSWGNLYISSAIDLGDFPVAFVGDIPETHIYYSSSVSAMVMSNTPVSNASAGKIHLVRGTTTNSASGTIFVTATGKWK